MYCPYIIESVIEGREWGLGVNSKIPVEQKLANYGRDAQGLVPIAKKAEAALKQMGLGEHVAAVALVLDISGSMNAMFEDGTVQKVIERVMGLGLNFDDNGAIDIFAFAMDAFDLGEITPDKFSNAAEGVKKSVHSKLTAQTNTESERHKWTGNIIWKEIPGIIWGDIDMWGYPIFASNFECNVALRMPKGPCQGGFRCRFFRSQASRRAAGLCVVCYGR